MLRSIHTETEIEKEPSYVELFLAFSVRHSFLFLAKQVEVYTYHLMLQPNKSNQRSKFIIKVCIHNQKGQIVHNKLCPKLLTEDRCKIPLLFAKISSNKRDASSRQWLSEDKNANILLLKHKETV
ncbi:hypothetical protein HS088_TW21G01593 [Tripterygium wilfordii]|uniref:Uncharacterized protein n=1 Tax=Tripterygium wilfordii TaxID=458696 RepID=A0A7J7C5M8_TRIWF|nr:hypothetical protein HS088_TW21G01593 [Tripterygium wilfordii]